jgi:hypothetical protein
MKKLLILISALATFSACQKEVTRDGSAPVQIRISTGMGIGGAATRAAGDNFGEETVDRVDVLVFNNTDTPTDHSDATLVETRYAYKKSGDLYNTTLKAGTGLDLYFAINAEAIIAAADFAIGDTWATVQQSLIMTPANMINRAEVGLPMWGYRYGETISSGAAGNNFGTVFMTRAIASADVTITATNFNLLEGSVEYVTDKGYLAYLVDEVGSPFSVGTATGTLNYDKPQMHYWLTEPQIPSSATTGTSPADYRVVYTLDKTEGTGDGNNILKQLYFFENDGPNSETNPTNGRKYAKLVLKGAWDQGTPENTSDDIVSYYPLAFRDRAENGSLINERVDIIRNRKFAFEISNVNGNGYPTLEEAKNGGDLNMKYEVIPWENWNDSDIVVGSDSRWVSISPSRNKQEIKQASLYRNMTSTDEINFTTNYDVTEFTLALTDGATVALTADDEAAGIIAKVANEYYEIALVDTGDNAAGEATGKFIFTALQDYVATPPVSTLTVSNPYMKFLLKVDQENSSPEDWVDGGDQPWTAGGEE